PKNFLFRCELLEPGSYLNQGLYELRSPSSSDQTAERPSEKAQVTTRQNPPHRSDVVAVGAGGGDRLLVGETTVLDQQNCAVSLPSRQAPPVLYMRLAALYYLHRLRSTDTMVGMAVPVPADTEVAIGEDLPGQTSRAK